MNNFIIILFSIVFISIFCSKKVSNSVLWKATVTPLASIIGSGFLVITPLYILIFGKHALLATVLMVCIAYMMGYVMRFNIQFIEPLVVKPGKRTLFLDLEHLSYITLGAAYFISIPFYIKLLSLFLLKGINEKNEVIANCIATIILIFIGVVGKVRGFNRLEFLEKYAVNIKLSIILSMIIGLIIFNINLVKTNAWQLTIVTPVFNVDAVRKFLGTIVIIQGFETSRFIWLNYDGKIRIRTMRYAQIISGLIYVVFVGLSLVVFDNIKSISETSIIDMSVKVAIVLPCLLIIASVLSQFSAAVADTISAGGLLAEVSTRWKKPNNNYLIIATIAIGLTWLTDIFQIISIASRAFAIYYAIQSFEATIIAFKNRHGLLSLFRIIVFAMMTLLMGAVGVFGISA